ncbi:MAG: DUF4956 domain-containing protein [Opitutaceae bacterium]
MPEFLTSAFRSNADVAPIDVLLRLFAALAFGGAVAWIYRRARGVAASSGSFPGTLVLLAILIAMVTQVIGDNVARAFSLVGALSIVRFRTVVRDTQDTAYVIFAVVVGMSVGSQNLWVAGIGLVVVGIAAWLLCRTPDGGDFAPWVLSLRVGLGFDHEALAMPALLPHLQKRELISVETARQGASLDVVYEVQLRPEASAAALVKDLHRIEGVQAVSFKRRGFESL